MLSAFLICCSRSFEVKFVDVVIESLALPLSLVGLEYRKVILMKIAKFDFLVNRLDGSHTYAFVMS